jgi:hypothetical protein
MNRVLKTFLLWLLIAVLPVQGFGAVLKRSCGPVQAEVLAQPEAHAMPGMAHHGMMMDHEEGRAGYLPATPDSSSKSSPHGHKSSTCNSSAVCCFGAAAPPFVTASSPHVDSAESYCADLAAIVTGFIPDSLERPPRPYSA